MVLDGIFNLSSQTAPAAPPSPPRGGAFPPLPASKLIFGPSSGEIRPPLRTRRPTRRSGNAPRFGVAPCAPQMRPSKVCSRGVIQTDQEAPSFYPPNAWFEPHANACAFANPRQSHRQKERKRTTPSLSDRCARSVLRFGRCVHETITRSSRPAAI